jgi:aldose 1-epimerase
MNYGGLLRLSSGQLELTIVPDLGGGIANFTLVAPRTRIPILRDTEGLPNHVLEAASFPLVPYCNRIRGGAFTFRGDRVVTAPNMPPDPSPLHGHGWLSPWQVERASDAEAELSFVHEPGEWPWRYEARQFFTFGQDALHLRLACRNLSDRPMPCGLGQHPYFPCTSETRIDTRVEGAWTIDRNVLPVERVPAAGRFDLRDRLVCGQDLDHGFDGWSGSACITDPGLPFEIQLSSPTAKCFQLYSPAAGGLFVAEPVSHVNAALNAPEEEWQRLGLQVLDPGEEMVLDSRIALVMKAD